MTQVSHDQILIIDFGSQVTQLIARRVREMGVYSEVVPFQKAAEAFARMKPRAVILSGGPASPAEADSPRAPQIVFEAGVPVLGICYGQMLLAAQLGGQSGKRAPPGIWPGGSFGEGAVGLVRRRVERRGQAHGVDEPWRPHHAIAAGLCGERRFRKRALCGHRR